MLSKMASLAKLDSASLSAAAPAPDNAGGSGMPPGAPDNTGAAPIVDEDDDEEEDEEDDDDDEEGGALVASRCICRCLAYSFHCSRRSFCSIRISFIRSKEQFRSNGAIRGMRPKYGRCFGKRGRIRGIAPSISNEATVSTTSSIPTASHQLRAGH